MDKNQFKVFELKNKLASLKSTLSVIESKSGLYIFNAQKSNYFKLELTESLLTEFEKQVREQINLTEAELAKELERINLD